MYTPVNPSFTIFSIAKATHIFSAKISAYLRICVLLDVNFNESLTNDIVSFEQLGPEFFTWKISFLVVKFCIWIGVIS